MATWADFVTTAKNRNLIRKSLDAAVLLDTTSTAVPEEFFSPTDGSLTIPATAKKLGWHSEDGLQWAREVENSEIPAHGSVDPVRTDVVRVNNTLQVTALETNIVTIGLDLGMWLDPSIATKYGVGVAEATRPKSLEFRTIALSVDDTAFGDFYSVKVFSIAKVDSTEPGAWAGGDAVQSHGYTIKAQGADPTAGYSVKHYFGGPGFEGLCEDMGFTAPV